MRSRSVAVAIGVSVLSAGGAGLCFARAHQLREEGAWKLARGNAQGEEYATTLDSSVAEQQLATFEERRVLLEQAHLWQRFQLIFIMLAVVAAFSSYMLHLYHRLRVDLVEADDATIS